MFINNRHNKHIHWWCVIATLHQYQICQTLCKQGPLKEKFLNIAQRKNIEMRQRQTGEGRHSLQTNLFSATTVLGLCTTDCTSQGSTTGTICHEQRTRARSFYWAHCSSAAVEACPRDIWDKLASSSAAPHQPSLLQTDVAQSSRLLYFFTIFCTQDDLHLRNRKYEPCTCAVEVWSSTFVQVVNTFGCQTLLGDIASKLIWIQDGADSLSSLLSISKTQTSNRKCQYFGRGKKDGGNDHNVWKSATHSCLWAPARRSSSR